MAAPTFLPNLSLLHVHVLLLLAAAVGLQEESQELDDGGAASRRDAEAVALPRPSRSMSCPAGVRARRSPRRAGSGAHPAPQCAPPPVFEQRCHSPWEQGANGAGGLLITGRNWRPSRFAFCTASSVADQRCHSPWAEQTAQAGCW
jgi:hypothetical protein